ncbi:MAG: pyridoxamine 5'-phosphate oxidase family protein [Burkholderiaceae bacterium]
MPIQSVEKLREIYGDVSEVAAAKQISALDEHCRHFISLSPFLVLSTSNGQSIDASPKGDDPGFVQIDDSGSLLIPDWPGNRRLDGLSNVLAHPQVGLIFLIPGLRETLRVNGAATIHNESDLLARFERKGKLPITVLRVVPAEIFMHCAKAFMRAKLWQPETWPEKQTLPRMIEIIQAHAKTNAYKDEAEMQAKLDATLY